MKRIKLAQKNGEITDIDPEILVYCLIGITK